MKQPQLGNKVLEIRNSKGLTQKELSESCNVDIRTIQRIESGEVIPRWSTIRILAAALDCDEKIFSSAEERGDISKIQSFLVLSIIMGIIYFINWLFYSKFIPGLSYSATGSLYIFQSIIHMVAGVLFFYGYFLLAGFVRNRFLRITSIIIMITLPVFVISNLLFMSPTYHFTEHLSRVLIMIMGLNGVFFGIGLLRMKSESVFLYRLSGIIQILVSPMYIFPVSMIQLIGLYLSILLIILLIVAQLITLRNSRVDLNLINSPKKG